MATSASTTAILFAKLIPAKPSFPRHHRTNHLLQILRNLFGRFFCCNNNHQIYSCNPCTGQSLAVGLLGVLKSHSSHDVQERVLLHTAPGLTDTAVLFPMLQRLCYSQSDSFLLHRPFCRSRFRMMLRIILQMAHSAHSFQVLRSAILRCVVQVSNRQRPFVRVKRFSRFPALLSAYFAYPSSAFLLRHCDSLPVRWIPFFFHRHILHRPSICSFAHSMAFLQDLQIPAVSPIIIGSYNSLLNSGCSHTPQTRHRVAVI